VNDVENPYGEKKESVSIGCVGIMWEGRSLMWGRQSYRLGDMDFEANAKDGIAIDWPVRYKEIAPWYEYVETFAGISGQAENLPQLPDSKFLPPMDLNCVEKELKKSMMDKFGRMLTIGRVAHVTGPSWS
jgi:choline dehydrogenase-like flavoprotein